ncbi:hypothetical protein ACFWRV_27410 [Streptomyces sp. NPDC058576]|uniref:hypothetical protein n=1 Tax=Streptomyces sp. NPDC058576 TaxID=3346547 RepID=UPI00364B39D6
MSILIRLTWPSAAPIRVVERVDGARALLGNALTVHSTLVTINQDEAMRRMSSASLVQGEESRRLAEETIEQGEQVETISSWAAILFTPSSPRWPRSASRLTKPQWVLV